MGRVQVGFATVWIGMAGLVGYGMVGSGTVCLGLAGEVRQCALGIGWVRQVKMRFGLAGKASYGGAGCGRQWQGSAGEVWHGLVMYGKQRFGRFGSAREGWLS